MKLRRLVMDERVERQLRWLEEALGRLRIEIMSLAVLVEPEVNVVSLMMPTISRLEEQLEGLKGLLAIPPVENKREIGVDDLSFEGAVAGTESKPEGESVEELTLSPEAVVMIKEELADLVTELSEEAEKKEEA
jgi:hypothetical protein